MDKIARARRLIVATRSRALLEVDGGVKVENAGAIIGAGADVLVAGSAIFSTPDYGATISAMRNAGLAAARAQG